MDLVLRNTDENINKHATIDDELHGYMDFSSLINDSNSKCQSGASIVLERLVKIIVNKLNQIHPSELDDELSYQSSFTYSDYNKLLKYINDNKSDNCASLYQIETLLSDFFKSASVNRPSERLFENFSNGLPTVLARNLPNMYQFTTIFVVCLTSWILNSKLRVSKFISFMIALALTGFLEFYLEQQYLADQQRLNQRLQADNNRGLLSFISFWSSGTQNLDEYSERKTVNVFFTSLSYLLEASSLITKNVFTGLGEGYIGFERKFSSISSYTKAPIIFILVLGIILFFFLSIFKHIFVLNDRNKLTKANKALSNSKNPRKAIKNGSNRSRA